MNSENLAVVAGNGLSVAISDEFLLSNLTQRFLDQVEDLVPDGSPALNALKTISQRIERDESPDESDFEKLVGAFETQATLIQELRNLLDLVPTKNQSTRKSLEDSEKFARSLSEFGTGVVLKSILDASKSSRSDLESLLPFFEAIIDGFRGTITFANLNYDAMVMSCLNLIDAPMCDLALGFNEKKITITTRGGAQGEEVSDEYTGYPLRTSLNFPGGDDYRVQLLHLHGSVTYWMERGGQTGVKMPIEVLRTYDMFSTLAEDGSHLQPAVVLANSLEKPKRVREFPFRVGYDGLKAGLTTSDYWLVVGYSFRDASVNEVLRDEFLSRRTKPQVLVVTRGDGLLRKTVEHAFAWGADDGDSAEWLSIERSGIEEMHESRNWKRFLVE